MNESEEPGIGGIIRDRRRALGLSQDDLAMLAGVSRRPITLIESNKGDLRLSTLEAILKPLGLKVAVAPMTPISARLSNTNPHPGQGQGPGQPE